MARVPRRARASVGRVRRITPTTLLIAAAAVCWAITARRMQGMDMGPGTDLGAVGWFTVVWATMMAAMMLPSLAPKATVPFAAGFLVPWLAAGLIAYHLVQGVRSLDLTFLSWDHGGRYVAAAVIVGAALYELTPAKRICLGHCRTPRRHEPSLAQAFGAGAVEGVYCVGCCWALMAALFALGVMNVAWMIVVAGLVAIEKLLPWDRATIGATVVFIAALGLAVAFAPDQVPGLTIPG
jgi:predicted metal-binding membrane protein